MQLTDQQLTIAHTVRDGRGNLAVNAGAGSGKTSTAMAVIKDYIPATEGVLYCAFNRKIKQEVEKKFADLKERVGTRGFSNAAAKTFNGIAYGAFMSRKNVRMSDIEMNEQKYLKLARKWVDEHMSHLIEEDRDIAADIINGVIHYARVNTTYALTGSYDVVVLTGKHEDDSPHYVPLEAPYFFGNEHDMHILREIAWKYDLFGQLEKDEDEERLLKAVPELLAQGKQMMDSLICNFTDQVYWMVIEKWKVWKNKWVIVDEAQDLSPLFRALVDNCFDALRGGRVLMIGDPQQAIYGFTGADNDGFANSMRFWKIDAALPLTISWRCPVSVAELARAWKTDFQAAPNAIEGVVGNTSEEALVRDAQAGDAIISRTRGPMIPIWQKLVAKGKPAIIVGNDVSKSIIKILERVSKRADFKFSELPVYLREYKDAQLAKMKKKDKSQDELDRFIDQMEAVNGAVDAVEASSMEELIRKIKDIFAKNDEEIDETQAVMIMTGHTCKGLEFNRVYMLTPTLFPMNYPGQSHSAQIQEMNLRYVVQTRAMRELLMVTSKKEPTAEKPVTPAPEVIVEPLSDALNELDTVVQKLLDASRVEIIETPLYDATLIEELLTECLSFRKHLGNPIVMNNHLRHLGDLAQRIKDGSHQGSTETLDTELRVGT